MNKENYVHQVFENIASSYDAANQRISLGLHMHWKRSAVRLLLNSAPVEGKFLDLCCGTGDMIQLILKFMPECRVTGIDFSANMLAEARKRFKNSTHVELIEGNAMAIPSQEAAFDGAVISFALRNTADYEKVISELARVLRPAGKVCLIDSFVPQIKIIQPFYKLYFSCVMPLLGGGRTKRKEYLWLNKSTEEFITPKELKALMKQYFTIEKEKSFMFGSCVCVTGIKKVSENA